jgi:hypothetical protein
VGNVAILGEILQKKKVPFTMLLLRTFSLPKWQIWQRIFATKKSLRLVSDYKPWFEATQPTLAEKRRKRKQHESLLMFTSNKQM